MTPNPTAIESTALVLAAGLRQIEQEQGRTEALGQAAGLVMGAVIGLADLQSLDELAATVTRMARDANAVPDAAPVDIAAIPHPPAEGVTETAHHVVRTIRQVRASDGDAVALERAAAALLAGSRSVRTLTDGATLALLLQRYGEKAVAADEMLTAGELPDPQVFQ